jgi:hypothetical protein
LIDSPVAPQVKPLGHIFIMEITFPKAKPITFVNQFHPETPDETDFVVISTTLKITTENTKCIPALIDLSNHRETVVRSS